MSQLNLWDETITPSSCMRLLIHPMEGRAWLLCATIRPCSNRTERACVGHIVWSILRILWKTAAGPDCCCLRHGDGSSHISWLGFTHDSPPHQLLTVCGRSTAGRTHQDGFYFYLLDSPGGRSLLLCSHQSIVPPKAQKPGVQSLSSPDCETAPVCPPPPPPAPPS